MPSFVCCHKMHLWQWVSRLHCRHTLGGLQSAWCISLFSVYWRNECSKNGGESANAKQTEGPSAHGERYSGKPVHFVRLFNRTHLNFLVLILQKKKKQIILHANHRLFYTIVHIYSEPGRADYKWTCRTFSIWRQVNALLHYAVHRWYGWQLKAD